MTRAVFATWISPTRGITVDGDVVWVQAVTAAAADTLGRRMVRLCEEASEGAGKPNAELEIFVEPTVDLPQIENSEMSAGATA